MTASRANHLPAALAYGKAGLCIFPILEGTKDQPPSSSGAERRRLERGAKVRGPMPQARHQWRSELRAAARSRRQEEYGVDSNRPYSRAAPRASNDVQFQTKE